MNLQSKDVGLNPNLTFDVWAMDMGFTRDTRRIIVLRFFPSKVWPIISYNPDKLYDVHMLSLTS